ncbi:MAG: hypothetical protein IT314_09290 [Anaerolineales bacterium]|nr:hypothetical protein [Anaerolineales bacterium]
MFDNLRESASSSSFYEEDSNELYREPASTPLAAPVRRKPSRFLGLTGLQRFILSLMLLFTVCAIGMLAMFILGKMSL